MTRKAKPGKPAAKRSFDERREAAHRARTEKRRG